MGAVQRLSFEWNDHKPSITASFHDMLLGADLVDVTLTCEGQSIRAHKLVLSACSPYFKGLFQNHPVPHPVIFLVDAHIDELKILVEYMYSGKIKIPKDNMTHFVKLAQALKVRGLDYLYEQIDQLSGEMNPLEGNETADVKIGIRKQTTGLLKGGPKFKNKPVVVLNSLPSKTRERLESHSSSLNVNNSESGSKNTRNTETTSGGQLNNQVPRGRRQQRDQQLKSASSKNHLRLKTMELRNKTAVKSDGVSSEDSDKHESDVTSTRRLTATKLIHEIQLKPSGETVSDTDESDVTTKIRSGNRKQRKQTASRNETDESELEVVDDGTPKVVDSTDLGTIGPSLPSTSRTESAAIASILQPKTPRVALARKKTGGRPIKRKPTDNKQGTVLKKLKPLVDSSTDSLSSHDSGSSKQNSKGTSKYNMTDSSSSFSPDEHSTSSLNGSSKKLRPRKQTSGFASEGERSRAGSRLRQNVSYKNDDSISSGVDSS